ncbi:MAG: DUF5787 family protein [Halobacteriales archaeon]
MGEYAFELSLCAHLERRREEVVARQLGAGVAEPGNRVVDVVRVVPGPTFERRAALTPEAIPVAAIESDVGAGRARYWKDAFEGHPERARRAVERAVEIGFFERERRNGREYVRQVARYPDWFSELVGIENKPDLGRPGDLQAQLRTDVSLGLFDGVVLATASHVTGAHRNRIPEEVGIWRFHGGEDGTADGVAVEVVREPTPLSPDEPGVERLDAEPGRTDIDVVDPAEKRRARLRIAERAYGKGWRPAALPGCRALRSDVAETEGVPYCEYYDRVVDPAGCGPDCPGFDPGRAPDIDVDAIRAANAPWDPDPDGLATEQSGLDRFGE